MKLKDRYTVDLVAGRMQQAVADYSSKGSSRGEKGQAESSYTLRAWRGPAITLCICRRLAYHINGGLHLPG